jgi:hypothetical protein
MPNILDIDNDDNVCYWLFHPKNFGRIPDCVNLEFKAYFSSNTAHPYHLSVNSKNLCDDFPENLHGLGEKTAEARNKKLLGRGREPTDKYKGFLKSNVLNIRNIKTNDYNFFIKHAPIEEDMRLEIIENKAHCNIVLDFPSNMSKPGKAERNWMCDKLEITFGKNITSP